MEFQVESFDDVKDDIKYLLDLHYNEIALDKEVIPLDPDWDKYRNLYNLGILKIITARDEGKIVGYSIFFVNAHLHYKSSIYANNDLLYLHPEYRKGSLGIKLIKYSEKVLRDLGVTKILWHIKFNKDFRLLLHRLGYIDEDVIVGKIVKD